MNYDDEQWQKHTNCTARAVCNYHHDKLEMYGTFLEVFLQSELKIYSQVTS